MNFEDTKKWVADTKREFTAIHTRMDEDTSLLYDKYVMRNPSKQNVKVPGVFNVTMHEAQVFLNKVIANLLSSSQQTIVDSEVMQDKDKTKVEEFIEAITYEANQVLRVRDSGELFQMLCEQACTRGRIAERVTLWRDEDGALIPEVQPIDTRHFIYEVGRKGLIRGAYSLFMSKSQIEAEYGVEPGVASSTIPNSIEVWESWDDKVNYVWVEGGASLREQANPYGYAPLITVGVPTGSMFKDKEHPDRRNESIFYQNRDTYGDMDYLASTVKTISFQNLNGPFVYETDKTEEELAGMEYPGGARDVTPIAKGDVLEPLRLPDLNQATSVFLGMVRDRNQRGGLPNVNWGSLQWPLTGIAIHQLYQASGSIYIPLLQAISIQQQLRAQMLIKQAMEIKGSIEIGEEGHKKTFNVADLKGAYTVKFKYFQSTAELKAAQMALANEAGQYYDRETVLTDILEVENPAEILSRKRAEEAEAINPVIKAKRAAESLIEEADGLSGEEKRGKLLEAEMMAQMGVSLLEGEAEAPVEVEKPKGQGEGILSMFDKGGRGGRMPREDEEVGAL